MDSTDEYYDKIAAYVQANSLGVLSTVGEEGAPHGAVLYICADERQPILYFLTKTDTMKYQNLSKRPDVSLTICREADSNTLQASGRAFVVEDALTIDSVMQKMAQINARASDWLPPLSKMRAGPYAVVGVRLTKARLAEFAGQAIGSQHIFTEV